MFIWVVVVFGGFSSFFGCCFLCVWVGLLFWWFVCVLLVVFVSVGVDCVWL